MNTSLEMPSNAAKARVIRKTDSQMTRGNDDGSHESYEIPPEGDDQANHFNPLTAERGQRLRNVLVMMSFRSDDTFALRVQVLEFLRLKYIIAKASAATGPAHAAPEGKKLPAIKVGVLRQRVGYYPEQALTQIAEADVLVGLISHNTANVVFELATRVLLRDHLVLLLDGGLELLPIYLEGMIHIDYRKYRSTVVDQKIRELAAAMAAYDFDDESPPEAIKTAVDAHEGGLVEEIKHALRDLDKVKALRPPYMRRLARYITPAAVIDSWDTHDPLCVIEAAWKKMSNGHYVLDDLWGGPWVAAANESFCNFYGLEALPEGTDEHLEGTALLDRLEKTMGVIESTDRKAFEADQARIGAAVFFLQQNPPLRVPLRINDKHDDPRFRGNLFLPAIVNRATIGPRNGLHRTYLTVLYVPLQVGLDSSVRSAPEAGNGR